MIDTFERKPENYGVKVNQIFELLGRSLLECYDRTEKLCNEVKKMVSEIDLS